LTALSLYSQPHVDIATMATETASVPDNTEIFQQLESYPWEKDAEFQVSKAELSSLSSSLGGPVIIFKGYIPSRDTD
jgi:hypothetical protein